MINIVASIISYDIWFYISHIILHTHLYHFHKEHHYKPVPNFLDTYAGHMIETPFQSIGILVPHLFLSYTIYDIMAILIILNIRGMMRHDERCVFLVGNHHLLHHKYSNCNYGEVWIDAICGTTHVEKKET